MSIPEKTEAETAGDLLKALREKKELTLQEVAKRMNLDPGIIRALESNNFDSLPADTYARGYIRSYAKLLAADADEIIALYSDCAPAPPEIIPEVKHPTQTSSSDKPVKAFTYFITFLLVLLLIGWWQSHFVIDASFLHDTMDNITSADSQGKPPGLGYTIPIVKHPDTPSYGFVEEKIIEQEQKPTLKLHETAIENLSTSTQPEDPGYELVDRRGSGPDKMEIKLNADSWIEVFEASGEKVYLNLAREGQTLILFGTAPFSVLLGFSSGVSLEYNGELFDHAPYSRSGIARFTLGEQGTASPQL